MVTTWQFYCWVLGSIPGQRTKIPQPENKKGAGEKKGEKI